MSTAQDSEQQQQQQGLQLAQEVEEQHQQHQQHQHQHQHQHQQSPVDHPPLASSAHTGAAPVPGDHAAWFASIPVHKQQLYKTKLCRSFVQNEVCRDGERCLFAHGAHELRPLPATAPETAETLATFNDLAKARNPTKFKTRLCKHFTESGTCPFGDHCSFAHGINEQRVQILGLQIQPPMPPQHHLQPQQQQQQQQLPPHFATAMHGHAAFNHPAALYAAQLPYGNPSMPHQQHPQLQAAPLPPQAVVSAPPGVGTSKPPLRAHIPGLVKTKACRHFESKGTCPYGDKCCFAHGSHELRQRTPAQPSSYARVPQVWTGYEPVGIPAGGWEQYGHPAHHQAFLAPPPGEVPIHWHSAQPRVSMGDLQTHAYTQMQQIAVTAYPAESWSASGPQIVSGQPTVLLLAPQQPSPVK